MIEDKTYGFRPGDVVRVRGQKKSTQLFTITSIREPAFELLTTREDGRIISVYIPGRALELIDAG